MRPSDKRKLTWSRPGRHLSSCRFLCRSYSTWREAGRPSRSASDQVRDGREPQDRQGARPCGTLVDFASRRRGDRITGLMFELGHGLPSRLRRHHGRCTPVRRRLTASPKSAAAGHFRKYGYLTDGSAYGVKRICASTLAWICDLLTGPKILESRLLPRLSPATKYIPSGSTICLKSPQL